METKVVKFGGSSLASAGQFRKATAIIRADPARRYVVVSAPGKRDSSDTKVTDMLYHCCDLAMEKSDFSAVLEAIKARFDGIIRELGLELDLTEDFEQIRKHLIETPERDYMASRGEYLNGKVLAAYLNWPYVDPADCVCFFEEGSYDARQSKAKIRESLGGLDCAVISGFYGALPDGTIHTFTRGGSDVTGAIVAEAVKADIYENWTDVSGMLAADPRIVDNPRVIEYISYQELRELSYMGATVLHEDAVFPVRRAGIPINIRNTNQPDDPGTMIVASLPRNARRRTVTGVAGRKGFSSIQIEKSMMNSEIGFGAKLFGIIAENGLSFEHCPTGIDTFSVILATDALKPCRARLLQMIRNRLHPDTLSVEDNLALLAVVGEGMAYSKGVAARVFSSLADAGVNIRMIDQGSSEFNIIIAVEDKDYETALKSLYSAVM